MVAILLRPRADLLLIVMSAFWCGVVASVLILPRLTDANPPVTVVAARPVTVLPEPPVAVLPESIQTTTTETKTARLVPVHSVIPAENTVVPVEKAMSEKTSSSEKASPPKTSSLKTTSPASRKFDDRWADLDERRALPPAVNNASAQVAQAETKSASSGDHKDTVCGERGRRYYYLGHHQYWRCRR